MPVRVGLQYIDLWKESMEEQIVAYEQEPVITGQIVFYGPSYFTRWSSRHNNPNLRESLLGKSGQPCCINRGFGSSCTEHQLYYYPRAVRPLRPKVLVYAPHANYLSFGYTGEEAWELGQRVIAYAMTDFPGIRVYMCSSIPSASWLESNPRLQAYTEVFEEQQREFVRSTPGCTFVDFSKYPALAQDENFVEDGVHFTPRGYGVFGEIFRDVLKEELARY